MHPVAVPVWEILDGRLQNLRCDLHSLIFPKFYMRDIGHFRFGRGGDQLGVKASGDFFEARHEALHIHHHEVNRAGEDRKFLLQEASRQRECRDA